MKKLYTTLLLIVLILAAGVGVFSLVDVDATESKTENRRLAQKPEFSLSALADGTYISKLETYYSDTFPAREQLLRANKTLNQFYHFSGSSKDNVLILDYQGGAEDGGAALNPTPQEPEKQPEPVVKPLKPITPGRPILPEPEIPTVPDPDVPVDPMEDGKDYVDDTQGLDYTSAGNILIVGDRAMDIPTATDSIVTRYAQAVSAMHQALGDEVRVISLLTPNGGQFYSPKDFHSGANDQKAMIRSCYDQMDPAIVTVDAYGVISRHVEEYIYFRTDHHWTQLGAYYAYTAFCKAAGFEAVPKEEFETGSYEGFLGSMYNWTSQYPQSEVLRDNPDTVDYFLPIVETHARYYADADLENSTAYPVSVVIRSLEESQTNKYMCFLGGDHPVTVVESAAEGPVCMVLKESYGNAFVPFLTSHYSKIVVVDPREFNHDGRPSLDLAAFAKEQGIDDLIVINYPFMVTNLAYVKHLNHLIGIYE